MGTIRLLSDLVASQVAAGEVVERPASVLKELVENSIDAGAKRIEVSFQQGGKSFLRVTDDGCGMDRSDALLSLERHATSKIRTADDLTVVETLGFRGEAVPSIASVSRFRLATRQRGQEETAGTEIIVDGGKVIEVKDSGQSYGTQIEVRDLFYNVPARQKFLKGEQTEAAHVLQQLQILAVAHPEIGFTCLRDGREVFRLAASNDLAVRLKDLYGAPFLKRLTKVERREIEGVAVHGFFARPGEGRSDRSHQLLFVNARMVRSPLLSQALREACDGILSKGLHPQAVLFFEIDPTSVDCNVHPAKREVRFQDPKKMREAALQAASQIMGNFSSSTDSMPLPLQEVARPYTIERTTYAAQQELPVASHVEEMPPNYPADPGTHVTTNLSPNEEDSTPQFRYVGRVAQRYFILEEGDGFILLEIRAALERITYDALRRSLASGVLERQRLLLPEVVEVSPSEWAWVMAHQQFLEAAGLEVDAFGDGNTARASKSLKVDAIPVLLKDVPVTQLLHQLIGDLQKEESQSTVDTKKGEAMMETTLARSVSSMAALAQKLPDEKATAVILIRDLLRCELPYATPSGRPTMIQFSEAELQRKFKK